MPTLSVCFVVLTWGGEVSAVSQDAIRDSRWARAATVIDDWDEEFDRGKVWGALEAGVRGHSRWPRRGPGREDLTLWGSLKRQRHCKVVKYNNGRRAAGLGCPP